jgi:hypothetical protein
MALSGRAWWYAYESSYPNSRDINDLGSGFRSSVEAFVGSLKHAGATVIVSSTRRNAIRAFLMHYSWKVAYGQIAPGDVPRRSGLDIEWDHGDLDRSQQAAQAMVDLFGMAHIAALNSNHIRGEAIDMNISWRGNLVLTRSDRLLSRIESSPRTGQNRELHEVGANEFGVRKLVSDPPHWSSNGR